MIPQAERRILDAAIQSFGEVSQMNKIVEECAELIAAIMHFDLGKISIDELRGEIADVSVMIDQAKIMLGESEINNIRDDKLINLIKLVEQKNA